MMIRIMVILVASGWLYGVERPFFIGAGATWSILDEDLISDSKLGYKLFGGYTLTNYFAVEAGYHQLGKLGQRTALNAPQFAMVEAQTKAWTGAFLFSFPPSDRFELFARLGISYHMDQTVASARGEFRTIRTDNTDFLGGIGTRISISPSVALIGEWERHSVHSANLLDSLSLGFTYRF